MRYLYVIIIMVSIFAAASAQVDTLMLVEIGSIQAPSEITGLYVEDLDGDSLKEIIICTDYYVYIYNGQTYQVVWTSPPLNGPTDLLFEDINGNGLIDLSVKDSTNIYLFDPHTPQAIWTSPALDSTYKCYTIGDRNDDDWIDVAIVSKELFTRPYIYNNMDTVWIELFNGPTFQDQAGFIIFMENWYMGDIGWYWLYQEYPSVITIDRMTGYNGMSPKIVLFSNTTDVGAAPGYTWGATSGNVILINTDDFSSSLLLDVGSTLFHTFRQMGGFIYMYALTDFYLHDTWGVDIDKKLLNVSADTLLAFSYVWRTNDNIDWGGFVVNDISLINNGLEICYSAEGSLVLLKFPVLDTLWERTIDYLDSVLYEFNDSTLFASPQVIAASGDPISEYRFFDGEDGSLSAILPDPGFQLSHIADLNGDGNDEILSIQDQMIIVYDLDVVTGIHDVSLIPDRIFLRPNYPNPFNSFTTIECGLPEAGRLRIDIYDLLGRKVESLVDEERQAGRYRVVWDASEYSSGVYFYRIEAGEFIETRRMTYLK